MTDVVTLYIPESVVEIGSGAFMGMTKLRDIIITPNVTLVSS